jgi:hypothetical protein
MFDILWRQSLKDQKIGIAQRCYAALGDVARSKYLGSLIEQAGDQNGQVDSEEVLLH